MKKQKKKLIALINILAFLFIISNVFSSILSTLPLSFNDPEELTTFPRSSTNEITIITPENKTYDHMMQGYYPATYGFENDKNGEYPNGWDITEPASTSVQVISEIDGHKKVVELQDNSDSEYPMVINSFPEKTSGIIEFWIYQSNANEYSYLYIYDDSPYDSVSLRFDSSGEISYQDTTYHTIGSYVANQWYHIKIEFDCSSGFYLYINGIRYGKFDFWGSPIAMDSFRVNLGSAHFSYSVYLDAVGYSWDSYKVGSNLHEGLVIGYENSTNLDWMGYSLDNQNNITILGNKTTPIPEKGVHSIQLFGNDTLGTFYQSEKRFFTVDPVSLDLLSPENRTYNEISNGFYSATYGFENEKDGADQDEISFVDNYVVETDCSVSISAFKNGHNNTLHLYDNNIAGRADVYNDFTMGQTQGTVEFWVLGTDIVNTLYMDVRTASSARIRLAIGRGDHDIYYYHDGAYHGFARLNDDEWYHMRIDFECGSGGYQELAADSYYVYINGIKYGPFDFVSDVDYLDELRISTASTNQNYHYYIDAIGYSWNAYEIGENLREGLSCNFESPTELDWMGYSLDNGKLISILGNMTLSLPSNGTHSIQVFGEDNSGHVYQTEKRIFTIEPLPLEILTPENMTHTYLRNGYYPATFGFENEKLGAKDTEIGFIDSIGIDGHAEIVQEKDNHKMVLNYSLTADYEGFANHFLAQSKGVIEYWIYYASTGVSSIEILKMSGERLYLDAYNGDIRYYDGSHHTIGTYSLNEWYHYAISFDCSSGTWTLWINNEEIGTYSFEGSPSYLRYVKFDGILNSNYYLDAISYSWDPYYDELRTNYNEGFLVDVPDIDYEWMDLYVDGEISKQTLGTSCIPPLSNGSHTIQVFAQDIEGKIFQSERRYFTLNLSKCKIKKQINIGSSDPFDSQSIKFNDGVYDETTFGGGFGEILIGNTFNNTIIHNGNSWGTTDGIPANMALLENDDRYLFLKLSTMGGDIYIQWGDYGNFSPVHQFLTRIVISYDIMVDRTLSSKVGTDLTLHCYDSENHESSKIISTYVSPNQQSGYGGIWPIEEGTVFNTVKSGGIIEKMRLSMFEPEGLYTTYLNIDRIRIYYYFDKPDLDLEYQFNCSEFGFENITEFDLNLDIIETVSDLDVNLWNYATSHWDNVDQISESGYYIYTISTNAEDYFENNETLKIKFNRTDYWDGRPYYNYRLKIDFIQIKIPPPDPPPNLTSFQADRYIVLFWDNSQIFGAPVLWYNIYRSNSKGGLMELIVTRSDTFYSDNDLEVNTTYYYEVRAFSLMGESFKSCTQTLYEDIFDPAWLPEPEDQTIEFGELFNYNVYAIDDSDITYSINDTSHFSINSETGMITDDHILSVGEYWLEIMAEDEFGNNVNKTIKITVEDTTDPVWNPEPEDQIIELGDSFNYDVNADDLSIITYSINEITYFVIDDNTGLITNASKLHIGIYWLEITAADPHSNSIMSTIKITVVDTTDPVWLPEPEDQVNEFGEQFEYDVNADDLSTITYFINSTTHFMIDQETGLIANATFLVAGIYWLEVIAEDLFGNNIIAIIRITVQDSTDPSWNPEPEDQVNELGEQFEYDVNADDLSTITYYINDTTYFVIDDEIGLITNASKLQVGVYWLEITAADAHCNFIISIIKITVEDTTDPVWNPNLEDQVIELGDSFNYDVNADDLSTIIYSLNDSIKFSIDDESGQIISVISLSIGKFWLEVIAEDFYGNSISAIIKITVQDTTSPIWNPEPEDQVIELGTSFNYNINAEDLSAITYSINDTTNFAIDSVTGGIMNVSSLVSKIYWLQIRAEDYYENIAIKTIKIIVTDMINPVWNPVPEDQVTELGISFNYHVNADDLSTITYFINSTTHFMIDQETGIITNATFLATGIYWLEITAEDCFGNNITRIIKITVQDTTDPSWNPEPEDQVNELGEQFEYDVNADDLSTISYSLNDTTYFVIDGEIGLVTNASKLQVGVYWLEITAEDSHGNSITSIIKITTEDTKDPVWNPEPENQVIELGTSFNYDVNADDLSTIIYSLNDSIKFSINDESGQITSVINLSVGDFWIEITAEDQYGNLISKIIKITVEDTISPVWNPEPEDQTVELGDAFSYNVNADDLSTVIYSIDDTTNFVINEETGMITSIVSLIEGEYLLEISAEDQHGNTITTTIRITVEDTSSPPPNIPGFEMLWFSIILVLTWVVILIKQKKKLIKI